MKQRSKTRLGMSVLAWLLAMLVAGGVMALAAPVESAYADAGFTFYISRDKSDAVGGEVVQGGTFRASISELNWSQDFTPSGPMGQATVSVPGRNDGGASLHCVITEVTPPSGYSQMSPITLTISSDATFEGTIPAGEEHAGEGYKLLTSHSFSTHNHAFTGDPVNELERISGDKRNWQIVINAPGQAAQAEPITLPVSKTIEAPDAVDLSSLVYTFDFQAASPVANEEGAFAVPSGVDLSTVTLRGSDAVKTSGTDSTWTVSGTSTLPDPNLFGHAGVYAFTVTESVSGANASDQWDNDQSVYKVRLYVVNDGNGGLAYDSVDADGDGTSTPYTIELVQGIDGAATSSKVAEATFLNIYDKLTDFTVTKAVSGDYANRTKEFAFDLVIDLPDYVADTTYAYTVGGVSATATAVEHVITISNFTLSADETLSFSNVLPVGSTYTLVEKDPTDGVNNYVPTASYTYAGIGASGSGYETATSTVAAGSAGGANYTVEKTDASSPNGNTALGAALGNSATVTNTLNNPPSPTGVLVSVLPFALMILIPIALGAVYFKTRRRDEEIYF